MRNSARPAVVIGAAIVYSAIVYLAIVHLIGVAAAQQSMSLPDVSVTAPNAAPLPPPVTKTSPYFGNTRVEEDKWPEIPCTASRIGLPQGATCKKGPPQLTFDRGDANGNRLLTNCRIAHDLVLHTLGHLTIEAEILVFDPYFVSAIGHQRQDCYVEAGYGKLNDQFLDMNQMTRQGSGWRNLAENGDLSTMEFSLGPDSCMALEKRGPRWGGGHVYIIHASTCRKDRRPVDATDVASVLGWLEVRQYEAAGNLH